MSWLVLLDAPIDETGEEVLRLAVGALAAGAAIRVVVSASARASLDAGELSAAADEYAQALDPDRWVAWTEAPWPQLLAECRHVLRAALPTRSGSPLVCRIDAAWLQETAPTKIARAVREAGQVLRA